MTGDAATVRLTTGQRRLLWILGIAAALVLLYFTALPGDLAVGRDDPDRLGGVYTVNGTDQTGSEYSGTVTIIELDDGTFELEWIITNAIQRGEGRLVGTRLETTWTSSASASEATGTVVYDLVDDGRLVGVRTVDGVEGTGTEELFPDG